MTLKYLAPKKILKQGECNLDDFYVWNQGRFLNSLFLSCRKPRRKKGDDLPSRQPSASDSLGNDDDGVNENTQSSSRGDKYRPKPGSAGYALLIALYKEELSPEFQVISSWYEKTVNILLSI